MMKLRFILLLFITPLFVWAQSNHADCNSALQLVDYKFSSDGLKGSGSKLEFSGNELGNLKFIEQEHNTIWLSFTADESGKLTFIIAPKNKSHDYDFMLFRKGENFCSELATSDPIRSNLARNDESNMGLTGLNLTTINEFSAAGVHNNFSKYVDVKSGHHFMLLVDANAEENDGFNLTINIKPDDIGEEISIEEVVAETDGFDFLDMSGDTDENKIEIKFKVLMEESNEEVTCHAEIIGVQWEDTNLVFEDKSSFSALIPREKWFYINVKKDGYTFGTEKYKASEELALTDQIIYISEVKKGNHIVLKEIVFRENTTHLLPSSINALEQLINFMNEYPTAEIEIQGHVNAPGFDNDGKVKRFSLKRAEQIKEYLVGAEIEGRRIKVAGMGNEFMIYPNPKSYDEEKANRRVEIEILSF